MTEINPSQANIIAQDEHHNEARFDLLTQFIDSTFEHHHVRIESLPGDASFRRYHRVYLESPKDASQPSEQYDPSYVVMDAPPKLESIESFVKVNILMEAYVNVPTLYAKDMRQGFLLLQDFGSTEFAHLLANAKTNRDITAINDLYYWAIDSLINLQRIKVDLARNAFHLPEYDQRMLEREMTLFSEWFLPYIGVEMDDAAAKMWQDFMQVIIANMVAQPQVVVHRDYHSRNLMRDQYHPEALGIIDFQDAVIGAYTYDLVSLVRDAYVDWNEVKVNRWIKYYWQHAVELHPERGGSLESFTAVVNITGIQRHLKVLGIFVRLAKRDGKQRYLQDIPKVWRDLMIEFEWLGKYADADLKTAITPMHVWLKQTVSPKFRQTFTQ